MGIPPIAAYPLPTTGELPERVAGWLPDPARAVLLIHDMQRYFLRPFPDEVRVPLVSTVAGVLDRCRAHGVPVAYTAQPGGMTEEQRGLLKDFWGAGMTVDPADREVVEPLAPKPGALFRTPARAPADPEGGLRVPRRNEGHLRIPRRNKGHLRGTTSQPPAPPRSQPVLNNAPRDRVYPKWRYSAFFNSDLLADLRALGRDQLIVCGVYAHVGVLMTAVDAFTHDIQAFVVADGIADFSLEYHRLALDYAAGRCAVVCTAKEILS